MTSPERPGSPLAGQGRSIADEAEGFLLVNAEREQARYEAETLCARLPWLTTGQAEDLTRHYVDQRLGLTRQALQTIADRAKRLRGEYETRYARLRRTLLKRYAAGVTVLLACALGATCLTLTTR
ncbi:hypothetical protein [Streptomyces sp. NPDC051452]|uniref:hypothetical protein n=1 Tax=Streptomyces sp. NPDC051452 TaxID=3365654 RepID=UPI0037ADB0C5